jgi:hypothetical protein
MKKSFYKLSVLFLLISSLYGSQSFAYDTQPKAKESHIKRRVVFDIGSSRIKIQLADVDVRANKIAEVLPFPGIMGEAAFKLQVRLETTTQFTRATSEKFLSGQRC